MRVSRVSVSGGGRRRSGLGLLRGSGEAENQDEKKVAEVPEASHRLIMPEKRRVAQPGAAVPHIGSCLPPPSVACPERAQRVERVPFVVSRVF